MFRVGREGWVGRGGSRDVWFARGGSGCGGSREGWVERDGSRGVGRGQVGRQRVNRK